MIRPTDSPINLRLNCANGSFTSHTAGLCKGHIQANLVVLPESYSDDFEQFCRLNPKPCPLLEKVGPGEYTTTILANKADLRKTLPQYRLFEHGKMTKEVIDIIEFYRSEFVFFLIGCSYSFENTLMNSGIQLRHVNEGKNVAMYQTNISLVPQGNFTGHMVVSMRPIKNHLIEKAIQLTGAFPKMHGAPVHIGDPSVIGISDINKVDYGEPITILQDETPVFWACGVTPQHVLKNAKLPFAITHAPGCMFVGDLKDEDYLEPN